MDWIVDIIAPRLTCSLRHRVLWQHLASPAECILPADDQPDAFHLGADDQGLLIGVASCFSQSSPRLPDAPMFRLRAMAVDPQYRKKRVGETIVKKAIAESRLRGASYLWCDAREKAVDFYSHIGFQKMDDRYDIPIIGPHFFMWLEL
jgi:GNAT superfamily N-acetyltransferase